MKLDKHCPLQLLTNPLMRPIDYSSILHQASAPRERRLLNEAWLRIRPQDMGAPAPADEKGPWALLLLDFRKQAKK
jgi:hypothetical protein